jgi:O-antigen ligase
MKSRSLKGIAKFLILGAAVLLVLQYAVYSYNKLKGKSYIHEPIYLSVKAKIPDYAKLEARYLTINDPTISRKAAQIIHDSIPENTFVFEIDSSYRLASFTIYFQLIRKNDEVVLNQIKITNQSLNEFNFSLEEKDLEATENLALTNINSDSIILRKTTENDPGGAALHFSTRGSLGGVFVRTGDRIKDKPSLPIVLVLILLGMLIAYGLFPIILRLEWKGISPGAFMLAMGILFLPSGEKVSNFLISMAVAAGFIDGIIKSDLLERLRKNRYIILAISILSLIYLIALLTSGGHPLSVKLIRIKFALPLTLMAVAINTNNKKELLIQFVALLSGVILSVYVHMAWAFILMDVVEVKSKLFSNLGFYLESTVFSRVHHSYLSIVYLFTLTILYYYRDYIPFSKSDKILFPLIILPGLLFAFSRAAILALIIILFYHIFKKIFKLAGIEIGTAIRNISALVLASALLFIVFSDLSMLPANRQINGLSTRMDIWEVASDLVQQKPLTGWGPGAYKDALNLGNRTGSFNSNTWNVLNTHNQFLATSGMFGLLAALGLIGFLLFPSGFAKRDSMKTDLIVSVAIIFITLFLFESVLTRNLGILIFGLSYGILIKTTAKPSPFDANPKT